MLGNRCNEIAQDNRYLADQTHLGIAGNLDLLRGFGCLLVDIGILVDIPGIAGSRKTGCDAGQRDQQDQYGQQNLSDMFHIIYSLVYLFII